MLAAKPEARFADIMERTLYNSILSGINVSGQGWTYTNPLKWRGPDHELLSNDFHQRFDPGERHICCPTNLLRTVASWHGCLYTTGEGGLWVHHYGANRLDTKLEGGHRIRLTQSTDYPWDGRIRIEFAACDVPRALPIRLRIPGWADGATLMVNGQTAGVALAPQSYAEVSRQWKPGDVIELNLPMDVQMIAAHPRLEQARNQAAVTRGPVVYCLESVDLPEGVDIDDIYLPRDAQCKTKHERDFLGGVTVLETEALVVPQGDPGGALYRRLSNEKPRPVPIRLLPYFAWNNRGHTEMQVWLPLR